MSGGWDLAWTIVAIAQLLGSAAVTLHVLWHKRSPVSAAAWIGLAWLAPATGAVLYILLGVNRIERRGRRLHRRSIVAPEHPACCAPACCAIAPPHLIALERAAASITGRTLLAGNSAAPLQHGEAAYPAMLAAIAEARHSIALASYIFRDDGIGRDFIDALLAAQARGVAVRVLLDGVGGGYFNAAAYRHLRRAGVPAARFLHSHLPWRMPLLNLRSHKTLLIIDGRTGFTGGINIGDENLDTPSRRRLLRRRRGIRDTHFRLDGPIVAQVMATFAEDWTRATMEWFWGHYADASAATNPHAAPLIAPDLSRLPPALVQVAEYDPLRDEGTLCARTQRHGKRLGLLARQQTQQSGLGQLRRHRPSMQRRMELPRGRPNADRIHRT